MQIDFILGLTQRRAVDARVGVAVEHLPIRAAQPLRADGVWSVHD